MTLNNYLPKELSEIILSYNNPWEDHHKTKFKSVIDAFNTFNSIRPPELGIHHMYGQITLCCPSVNNKFMDELLDTTMCIHSVDLYVDDEDLEDYEDNGDYDRIKERLNIECFFCYYNEDHRDPIYLNFDF